MKTSTRQIAYLALIASVLIFSLVSIAMFIKIQGHNASVSSQYKGSTWVINSVEREYLKMLVVLERYAAGSEDTDPVAAKERLLLQFDILWSRMPLLHHGTESSYLRLLDEFESTADMLAGALERVDRLLPVVDRSTPSTIERVRIELSRVGKPIHQLVIAAHRRQTQMLTTASQRTQELRLILRASFVGIIVSSLVLIIMLLHRLRREHGLLQAARQALESNEKQTQALRNEMDERRRVEAALEQEQERAVVTLRSIGDGVVTTDMYGRITYMNPVAEHLTGCSLDDVRCNPVTEVVWIVDESTGKNRPDPVSVCLRDERAVKDDNGSVLKGRGGNEFAVEESVAPLRDEKGKVRGAVLVFRDVSDARTMTRTLSHQATHDALTNLINRREFERRLNDALVSARTDGQDHALLYIDLDQFKVVNDTCGHPAGDELLRQLSALLQSRLRHSDTLARLGGDEFGTLLVGCSLDRATEIAHELRQTVEDYRFAWEGTTFRLGVSIGLVMITPDSHDLGSVLSAADVSCFAAKDAGRNRVHVYRADDELLARRHGEMHWVSRITQAMEDDRLTLYCQEIVSTAHYREERSGSRRHFEVLLRMIDERGRIVPPMAFLPAAERYDLMFSIDSWVVEHTLAWLAGNPELREHHFSINLSGQSLGDERFAGWVLEALDAAHIRPGSIGFEITETAAIANLNAALHFIRMVKDKGCSISLDDFGSGLSSFNYLKTLPVDLIKIDGTFVKDMLEDPMDAIMVESIARLGNTLGLETVAEFVENPEILDRVKDMGVSYVQGYAISRPRPISELTLSELTLDAGVEMSELSVCTSGA